MTIHYKKLDVRKLLMEEVDVYPEIRRVIDSLKPSEGLQLASPFLPSPLIEKLKSEGFACRPERQSDGSWVTHFTRK